MFRNWGKALKEMYTHVCKTAKRVKKQVANYVKKIDWKKVVKTSAYIAGVFFSVNDIYRVIIGGLSNIKKIIYDEVGISEPTDRAAMNALKKKNPVAYNFILNLQSRNGEYK
ncbi:hypothetical protein ACVR1I_07610 [Streptococcus cameli]